MRVMRAVSRAGLLSASLCVCSCAAPEAQMPADVLQRLQSEARTEIYDRENDLAIARNRLDEVRSRRQGVLRELDRLDGETRRVRERLGKAGPTAVAKAQKLEALIAAHRGYLDAQLRQLGARYDVAEAQAAAARGRLEQTRQRELVRTGRALARSMDVFDKSVEAEGGRVRELERREGDLRVETEKGYERWKASEDEYAKATGDWDTAVWTAQ